MPRTRAKAEVEVEQDEEKDDNAIVNRWPLQYSMIPLRRDNEDPQAVVTGKAQH